MPSPANNSNTNPQSSNDDNNLILRNRQDIIFLLMYGIARGMAHLHQLNYHRHIDSLNIDVI